MKKIVDMKSAIYLISWTNNHHFYIGQTQNFQTRKNRHLSSLIRNKHHNLRVQRVFNKYGEPQFHIVEECEIEELDQREQFYLDLLFSDPNCLNVSKYAEAPNRGLKHSEKTKKKISNAAKGEKSCWFGKKHTEETRKKMSAIKKGRCKGENNSFFGKKHSKEFKQKLSEMKSKAILQFSLQGEFIKEWASATEASKETKVFISNISACCHGKVKTAGGFIWKYKSKTT